MPALFVEQGGVGAARPVVAGVAGVVGVVSAAFSVYLHRPVAHVGSEAPPLSTWNLISGKRCS